MRFDNTKSAVKQHGADIKTAGKANLQAVKSFFKIFPAFGDDFRQMREATKLGYELLAKEKAEATAENAQ